MMINRHSGNSWIWRIKQHNSVTKVRVSLGFWSSQRKEFNKAQRVCAEFYLTKWSLYSKLKLEQAVQDGWCIVHLVLHCGFFKTIWGRWHIHGMSWSSFSLKPSWNRSSFYDVVFKIKAIKIFWKYFKNCLLSDVKWRYARVFHHCSMCPCCLTKSVWWAAPCLVDYHWLCWDENVQLSLCLWLSSYQIIKDMQQSSKHRELT